MAERMYNDPEIAPAQRKEFAGQVLAAIGIGQVQRGLHFIRARMPFQQTPYRWEDTAPYAYDGLTQDVHAWFSYGISTIGSRRPLERFSAVFLNTLCDEGVTDRTRETFVVTEDRTEYKRSVEIYDPITRAYQAATGLETIIDPEHQTRKNPITESTYATFVANCALIASGDLTRQS